VLRLPAFALLALPFTGNPLIAAVIRGSVVENQTSKPLARAAVTLQPVAGTPGAAQSLRADTYGVFEFSSLAAGDYVVKASKPGFLPAEYGQKQWNSAGVPVALTLEASAFLTIRLARYGAVTGTVLDENDVGLPRHDVLAYRNMQPPQLVGRATADDRGVYRLFGLEPGNYLVRTAAVQNDGIDYLPTFAKETQRVEEARIIPVYPDEESKLVDVRPAQGKLYTLSGTADGTISPVNVTLASDIGRQTVPGPAFEFRSLPPGPYELYAEAAADPRLRRGAPPQAAFMQLNLDRDTNLHLALLPVLDTQFEFAPPLADARAVRVQARRKDLAGEWPQQTLSLVNNRAPLFPGRWELSFTPPPGFYISGFSGPRFDAGSKTRSDGWNEISLIGVAFGQVKFSLSSGPGSVHGIVKSLGDAVIGAPVYLEAYDPDSRRRLIDLRSTRTDLRGAYRFDGLAPGTYRLLATFEYQTPDTAAMDLAAARQVQVEAKADLQLDLDLYSIR
jgi:hypothetical protein